MAHILECPQCESRFRISALAPRVDCPSCKLNFKPSSVKPSSTRKPSRPQNAAGIGADTPKRARPPRRLQTEASKFPAAPTRALPAPQQASSPAPPAPAKPAPPAIAPPISKAAQANRPAPTSNPKFLDPDSPEPNSGVAVTAAPPSPYRKRRGKKNRMWLTLLTLLMAVVAIGGLFAIITVLGKPDPEPEKPEFADAVIDDKKSDDDSKKDSIDKANAKLGDKKRNKPKEPVVPPVDETPVFFDERKGEIVWQKINSYLVRLEIQTPVAKRTQTGLIVDSRGWVLTSLQGLKDAGKVTVTVAAKTLNDRPPFRELSDEARGIIATNPELDLAIISINRIQVNNIADLPFYSDDDVVRAQRLMIGRTPPPGHQRWLAECRIDQRGSASQLDPTLSKAIGKLGMSTEQRYIVFPPRLKSNLNEHLAGSPLLDLQGNVMAINTGTMADGRVISIPAPYAKQFVESVPNPAPEPQPFARQSDLMMQTAIETEAGSSNTDGTSVPVELSLEDQFELLISKLDLAVTKARDTDWTAETAEEYLAMKQVPKYLLEIEQWLADNFRFAEDAEDEREQLQKIIDEIGDSLQADLDIEEMQAGKGNQFFEEHVSEAAPWFMAFVRVDKDVFNSPRVGGSETVVLRLLGTEKKLVAALATDVRMFRRNRWLLLLGRLSAKGSVAHDGMQMQVVDVLSAYQLSTR